MTKTSSLNKRFTGNNSFTGPNQQKSIKVSQGITVFRSTNFPKINKSGGTLIRETRVTTSIFQKGWVLLSVN